MKSKKILVVSILIFVIIASLAACGSSSSSTSTASTAASQAATAQPATATQVIPTADPAATVDGLIGSWQDINSADRHADISKVGDAYQYVDNDGTYPATFANGKLTLKVNTDTADVFVDAKTGHMFTIYQGNPTEFSKK
jgi:hypothetical protein